MSEVQKDSEDISAGKDVFKTLSYFLSFPTIWGQSWQGQLWPHPVQLGIIKLYITEFIYNEV
jgi:hypothetical protein